MVRLRRLRWSGRLHRLRRLRWSRRLHRPTGSAGTAGFAGSSGSAGTAGFTGSAGSAGTHPVFFFHFFCWLRRLHGFRWHADSTDSAGSTGPPAPLALAPPASLVPLAPLAPPLAPLFRCEPFLLSGVSPNEFLWIWVSCMVHWAELRYWAQRLHVECDLVETVIIKPVIRQ